MISRRLLRIKVFKILFSKISSGSDSEIIAKNELLKSCEKTMDLYYLLLNLPIELKRLESERIETGLQKFQPTNEELNPNRKFINNSFIKSLEEDTLFTKRSKYITINWSENRTLLKKIYTDLKESEYFKEYMSSQKNDFKNDKKLISSILRNELEEREELWQMLEDTDIYWADELSYVTNVILQNVSNIDTPIGVSSSHPTLFLQEEDKVYATKLLAHSLENYNDYLKLIKNQLINWEIERLALSDTLLIAMGISEAVSFPTIPLKVTINEYVEISKYYSTPNSRQFINGILEKIILEKKSNGEIKKSGRGLVGNLE